MEGLGIKGALLLLITVSSSTVAVMCLYSTTTCDASSSNLHPVIVVPGLCGSQIDARLTEEYEPTMASCGRGFPRNKDEDGWFRLWLDASMLFAPYTKCIADRMTLHYDPGLDDYRNAPGVETKIPGFGSTQTLLYLSNQLKQVTEYMASLVKSLEQIGYVDGETLFGAPYDFRYGLAAPGHPTQVGSKFLQDLKSLIENATTSNQGKPVILISHSLGGLFLLQFLTRNSPSWRQKHIKHFLALSTPWGGTVEEMLAFASGDTLGVPLIDPLTLKGEERSWESNLWLLPTPELFGPNQPLVVTPNKTYTAYDIAEFLNDIGFPEGVFPYETRLRHFVKHLTAPRVPVTCVIGTGVDTQETLVYGEDGFDRKPKVVYGDGDGTVNLVSLLAVQSEWADEKDQSLKFIRVPGVEHRSILTDKAALDEIIGEICSINSQLMYPLESM